MREDFIESLKIPEAELAKPNRQHKTTGPQPRKDEFCKFPFHVMANIAKVGAPAGGVIGVLAALYEIWYRDNHYNPVRLTTANLRNNGVSPTKNCALCNFWKSRGRYGSIASSEKIPS